MMKIISVPILFSGLCTLYRLSCGSSPADHHATAETRHLYQTLLAYTNNPHKIMFGHHRATAEGCSGGHLPYRLGVVHNGHRSWSFTDAQRMSKCEDDLCDVKDVTGQYSAVVSFDLRNLDHKALLTTGWLIKKADEKGLIVTLSWHQHNPVSGTSAYVSDNTGASLKHIIRRILENGDLNYIYRKQLDTIADWLKNLTDSAGRQIPVVFRPYHEMNGNWFWWGTNRATNNTAADYKHLFQYIVRYLRDTKQIHNLLYAFSPSKPKTLKGYYHFYPGDSFVDLLGMDYYYSKPFSPSIDDFLASVGVLTEAASAHDKLAAITEVGIMDNGIEKHHKFWTDHVLSPLKNGNGTTKVAYMLTWANNCMNRFSIYVPYHGHAAASNFREFCNDSVMVFGRVTNNGNTVIVG